MRAEPRHFAQKPVSLLLGIETYKLDNIGT